MLQLSFVWWVSDLLLVHGCYSGSYFVSAAYIVEKGKTCYLVGLYRGVAALCVTFGKQTFNYRSIAYIVG